ncbi:MAG TPA: sulfite exporter TauE/SafE family protein, partial [Candidatus Obscuribacterales bacterium]
MTESLLTVLIIFVTTVVSATFGFGSALFAMPILTLLSGLATATPLCGFVGPTISGLILAQNWRLVDLASAWRLVVTTLVGIPVGVALVKYAPGSLVARALGVFLVSFGLYRLVNGRLVQLTSARWALPIGFIAGVLGGAYNTNGPPIVVYGEMRRWSPTEFRATLQGYFLPTGLAIWVSHG